VLYIFIGGIITRPWGCKGFCKHGDNDLFSPMALFPETPY